MLGAILAAREPLPVKILQKLFDWRETELRKWLRTFGSLFPVTNQAGYEVIKPYHKSLADWLSDERKAGKYFVSRIEGHRLLGRFCFEHWKGGPQFCVSEVFPQLQLAQDWTTISRLLSDPRYHEDRFSKCSQAALHEDLVAYASGYSQHDRCALGQCLPEVRAVFSIDVMLLYQLLPDPVRWIPYIPGSTPKPTVPDGVRAIREFIERGNDYTVLRRERDKLIHRLSRARDAFDDAVQRALEKVRAPNYNRYAAHTEQCFEAYVVASLLALDAALALNPDALVQRLCEAQRFEAMYSEDGEPAGAVQMAIDQDKERLDRNLAVLQGTALRLSASLSSGVNS